MKTRKSKKADISKAALPTRPTQPGEVFVVEYVAFDEYRSHGIYSNYDAANHALTDYLMERSVRNCDFGYYPILGEDGWYVYSKKRIHNKRLDRVKPKDWAVIADGKYRIVKIGLDRWEE